VPPIDAFSTEGLRPETPPSGALSVEGVAFHYPARPDEPVYQNVTVDVPAGQTLALVSHFSCCVTHSRERALQEVRGYKHVVHFRIYCSGMLVPAVLFYRSFKLRRRYVDAEQGLLEKFLSHRGDNGRGGQK
jgi:hypothetical protein